MYQTLDELATFKHGKVFGEVLKHGVAIERSAIEPSHLWRMLKEVKSLEFTDAQERLNSVEQRFQRIGFHQVPPNLPTLALLCKEIQAVVRSFGHADYYPYLAGWQIRDIVIQKYDKNSFLSAHKDLKRHQKLIVICNLEGNANFEILETRTGPVIRQINDLTYGDIILLRGSETTPGVDDRPFHRVSGNTHPNVDYRISLTLRDNTEPQNTIKGFEYEN
jgi:alkylated DNA repair dioxygenase AlkB